MAISRQISANILAPPLAGGALVFAAALIAYLPALRAGFIWNDPDYVTAPALQSLSGLRRIWCDVGATEQYYPLLHTAFWCEHRLWGDAPAGYHLVNVLFHAGAACLFAALLRQLAAPGARLAALLFALHPVCVESVAWISEQKNTLSLVFYLGAALAYLRFESSCSRSTYFIGLALFIAALLSKTTTATLPAALVVIAWWRRGRLDWQRDMRPLIPWFVLGAAMGLFSAWVEKTYIGAEGADFALSFLQRGLLAGRIVWFYLAKLVLPFDLIFIYPRWSVDTARLEQWLFPLGALALLVALWGSRRRTRTPLTVALLFVGALFPVLGFFNVYGFTYSFVADHWQYLPCLAVIAGTGPLLVRTPRALRAVLCLALGVLTWRQSRLYVDMDTFYRATLARNPSCWMAHNNLAGLLRQAGRLDDAIAHYGEAVRYKPDSANAHNNLGIVLREKHRLPEALAQFQTAIELRPDAGVYQDNLAGALRDSGRAIEALPHHSTAIRLAPDYPTAHINYGVTLRALGRGDEALAQFEESVRLDPNMASARLNLALSYSQAGRDAEAEANYLAARQLNPAVQALDQSVAPRP